MFFKDATSNDTTPSGDFLQTPAAVRQYNRTYNSEVQANMAVPDTFQYVPQDAVSAREYLNAVARFAGTDLGRVWRNNNTPSNSLYVFPQPPTTSNLYGLLYDLQGTGPYAAPQFANPNPQVPAYARLALLRN